MTTAQGLIVTPGGFVIIFFSVTSRMELFSRLTGVGVRLSRILPSALSLALRERLEALEEPPSDDADAGVTVGVLSDSDGRFDDELDLDFDEERDESFDDFGFGTGVVFIDGIRARAECQSPKLLKQSLRSSRPWL
ncbi:unnamed protein product [Ilex paraguariensis]|uniref:Uncharacterized protein n=1 Tax=Ilex paraguariensis TaxID=185542 RepID=A0ABC8V4Y2_9AQUA